MTGAHTVGVGVLLRGVANHIHAGGVKVGDTICVICVGVHVVVIHLQVRCYVMNVSQMHWRMVHAFDHMKFKART